MNRREIILSFVNRHGWYNVPGGRGDFSVSPDQGMLKRMFYADLKMRKAGTMLLGVIGLSFRGRREDHDLELSAYITNFNAFSSPPILHDSSSLNSWVDVIVDQVSLLPSSIQTITSDINTGKVGPFPLEPFKESSPDAELFLKTLAMLS